MVGILVDATWGAQNENEECKKVRERQGVNQRRESRRAGQGVF
jgi:hypothetical protein